jgi:predicted O-methyltransferase YrrM
VRACAETLAAEMTSAELEALIKYIPSVPSVRFLEIGTAAGGTAKAILESRKEGKLYLVIIDTFRYFPNQQEIVAKNLQSARTVFSEFTLYPGTSDQIYRSKDEILTSLDALLIDASHKYRYVVRDIRWLSNLKVGGYAFFHDFNDRFPGVVAAVERYVLSSGSFQKIDLEGSLLILKKTRQFNFSPSILKLLLVDIVSRFVKPLKSPTQ